MSCMLRAMRQFRGLTQEELSEISGISVRTILYLEQHERAASGGTQAALAQVLGIPPQLRMVLFGPGLGGRHGKADRDR